MRGLSVPVSVLILGAAGAVLVAPIGPPPAPLRTIGVYGPGLLAVGLGLFVWVRHGPLASRVAETDPDERERRTSLRGVVGNWIDQRIRDGTDFGAGTRTRIEIKVERAVQTTLERAEGLPPAAARERIRDGTWTADPRAATLLARRDHRPPAMRLRDWLTGRGYRRCLRAAIDELDRRRGISTSKTATDAVRPRAGARTDAASPNRSRAPDDSAGTVDASGRVEPTGVGETATDDSGADATSRSREAIR
ncbi:DUF7269 family protein [Halovivax limisalsi]|uniref:DUF7269 family protein n=1 Tax=Halovivax limisalsi TaxID=1453760 RepID=UPI001FFD1FED|nr:hypothetical protein [Halovivax limisalsi]